jgi:hypothetical protein
MSLRSPSSVARNPSARSPVAHALLVRALFVPALLALVALPAGAQTLYTLTAGGVLSESAGPSSGPCAYPNSSYGGFLTALPHPCATVGAIPPGPLGDIAIDKVTDTLWATDGTIITGYSLATITVSSSFLLPPGAILPGPLTGLGFGGGLLWITDGTFVAGVAPPAFPGCGMPPAVVVPPWVVPAGVVPLSDVDYHPATGTLWASSSVGGFVSNLLVGGGFGPGGVFPATASCALAPALTGIAVDTTRPGFLGLPTTLYVSDGTTVAAIAPGGVVAPPSFHAPAACWMAAGFPSKGLAFSLHGITYGTGTDPGGSVPLAFTTGQSTVPSATFGLGFIGADPTPGTVAALFVDFAALCPALPGLGGNTIYALPTLIIGPLPVIGGALTLPAALPPTPFIGVPIFAQWIIRKGSIPGAYEVGAGMAFTLGLP